VVSIGKEMCVNLRSGHQQNIPNPITIEQVSILPNPKVYSMIDQLKNTLAKIRLYDIISTSQEHRDVLYALFKNKTIPTNISIVIFFKKLQNIR